MGKALSTHEDDHQLMARVAEGDAEAFRVLASRHAASVTAHAKRMMKNASEAEDVVQEAFIRLWKHAPSYRPEARLSTYLHRIVHNLCLDRLRAERPADPEALDGLVSDQRPSREIVRQERAAQVQEAVAALPERQRAALSLVHFEGLSNVEAADVMNLSVEAVESLLSRARRTLRERLAMLSVREELT